MVDGAIARRTAFLLVATVATAAISMSLAHPAQARGKAKVRTVEGSYSGPALFAFFGDPLPVSCADNDAGCETFEVKPGERFASVEIADQSGTPIAFSITQDTDGDGTADHAYLGCGSTPGAVGFEPNVPISVAVYPPSPQPMCPTSIATGGTITVDFLKASSDFIRM